MNDQLSMDDQFLRKIHQIIEDNLSNENFSVEDLAQQAGLSRSMLHRKLIKLTGESASDLITEKRLLKAKELLENNVATTSEIAFRVGFKSPSYFIKVFRKNFHVSPGDVRKGLIPSLQQISPDKHREIHHADRKKGLNYWTALFVLLTILAVVGTALLLIFKKDKPVEKSIAILPFDNLSSDSDNSYFADGIVEDILTRLSQIEGLKVISRTSTEMFRDKGNKTIPEIADLLHVGYILEGTFQRETDNIRINIQLIDAKRDYHILSKQYNRTLSEVFAIQSEIAGKIATELSLVLTDRQLNALTQDQTNNLKAFELYQMGRFHSSKRWIEGYKKGIEYYEKAIAEDPEYGLAYAGLADNYHLMALQGWMDKTEGKNKATESALKALELKPDLAEPHAVLGDLYAYADWNWEMAEKELLQAIKLNPNYSTAYQYYSELLAITGRYDKAREYMNKALEHDPFSFVIRNLSGQLYYAQGQFRKALEENQISQELVVDHEWAVRFEFELYYQLGMEQEAIESFKRYGKLFKVYNPGIADSVYENEGLDGLLRVKIETLPDINKYRAIYMHVMLGEYEQALDIMEKSYFKEKGNPGFLSRYEFRKMSNNPRFIKLLKKMGLNHYRISNN